jgi:hypothetical protein
MSALRRTIPSACGVRASLPGPSRRITVEPIRVPAEPKEIPSRQPSEAPERPERSPEREPVPAR